MFRQIFASVVVIACMSAQGAAIQLQSSAAISTQATDDRDEGIPEEDHEDAFVSAEANETDAEAKADFNFDEMDAVDRTNQRQAALKK